MTGTSFHKILKKLFIFTSSLPGDGESTERKVEARR